MCLPNFVLLFGILHLVTPTKIDSRLTEKLKKIEKVNALIIFKTEQKSTSQKKSLQNNDHNRTKNIESVIKSLKKHSDSSQSNVVSMLSTKDKSMNNFHFKKHWISNTISVKDINSETLKKVAKDSQVKQIIEEPSFKIPGLLPMLGDKPQLGNNSVSKPCKDWNGQYIGWHFEKIKRTEAWEELNGDKGNDIVVATIGTGVRHTHETLRDNFRGSSYGWFDSVNGTLEPFDSHNYGTAITSIIAGSNDVGIAPEATWISCRACKGQNVCKFEHVFSCLEWIICPTLPDGSNPDCSNAPHVLAFPFCGDRTLDLYDDMFEALASGGIITVAPVGDEGSDEDFPGCGHTCSPSNSRWVIGVGGSTTCDRHKFLSSKGPAPDGSMKPDLVAPFDQIYAADAFGDSRYDNLFSGTTFSTAQVVGVVALLLVRKPMNIFKNVHQMLTRNADRNIQPDLYGYPSCNKSFKRKPNIYVGFGRLDAYASLRAQSNALKPRQTKKSSGSEVDFLNLD